MKEPNLEIDQAKLDFEKEQILNKIKEYLIKRLHHPMREKTEKKKMFSNSFQEWDQNFDGLLWQKKVIAQDLTLENSSFMKDQESQYEDKQYQALVRQPYEQKHFKNDMEQFRAVLGLNLVNTAKELQTKNNQTEDEYRHQECNSILPDQRMKEQILSREQNLLFEKLNGNKSKVDTFEKGDSKLVKEQIDQLLFLDGKEKKHLVLQKISDIITNKLILKIHLREHDIFKEIEIQSAKTSLHPDYISYELSGSTLYFIKHFHSHKKHISQICALDLKNGELYDVIEVVHSSQIISMMFLKDHVTEYVLEKGEGHAAENPEEGDATEKHAKFLKDKLFVIIKSSGVSRDQYAVEFGISQLQEDVLQELYSHQKDTEDDRELLLHFQHYSPIIYRIPKDKFCEYGFRKGVDSDPVENYSELTYGSIQSPNDLIYLSFFYFTKRGRNLKSENRVVLDIKGEGGKTSVSNLKYHIQTQDPQNVEIIRNSAILKILSHKIYESGYDNQITHVHVPENGNLKIQSMKSGVESLAILEFINRQENNQIKKASILLDETDSTLRVIYPCCDKSGENKKEVFKLVSYSNVKNTFEVDLKQQVTALDLNELLLQASQDDSEVAPIFNLDKRFRNTLYTQVDDSFKQFTSHAKGSRIHPKCVNDLIFQTQSSLKISDKLQNGHIMQKTQNKGTILYKNSFFVHHENSKSEIYFRDDQKGLLYTSKQPISKDRCKIVVLSQKTQFIQDDRSIRPFFCAKINKQQQILKQWIVLYDMKNAKIIDDFPLRNYFPQNSFKPLEQFQFVESSDPRIKSEKKVYEQSYQLMQFLEKEQVCLIQEFNIVYDLEAKMFPAKIEYVGQKILIFNERNKIARVQFFPRMNMNNVIVGSQIIAKRESNSSEKIESQTFVIGSMFKNEFKFNQELMIYSNCRIYKENSSEVAVLAEVKLSDIAYNDIKLLKPFELNQLFSDQIQLVLNTVPFDLKQIILREAKLRFVDYLGYGKTNPLEILKGQTILNQMISSPKYLEQALRDSFKSEIEDSFNHSGYSKSFIERVLIQNGQNGTDPSRLKFLEENQIFLDTQNPELSRGLDQVYMLHRIIQNHETYSADILMNSLNSKPQQNWQFYMMMMQSLELAIEKNMVKIFIPFLSTSSQEEGFATDYQENMEIKINDKGLEIYSESELPQNRTYANESVHFGSQPLIPIFRQFDREICNGKNTYYVDHSLVDFRGLIYRRKLDFMEAKRDVNEKISVQFDSYELNNIMSKFCHLEDQNISELSIIKKIIDYQFQENTYSFFNWQALLFWICYALPMILLVTETEWISNFWVKYALTFSCVILQIVFFAFEILQFWQNGYKRYKDDYWNFVDFLMFVFNLLYLVLRAIYYDEDFVPSNYKEDHVYNYMSIFMISIAVGMVVLSGFKGMSLVRHFNEFGQFVELFTRSFQSLNMFMCFFLCQMIVFGIIYILLGVTFDEADYPGLNFYVAGFIQIFRNSIGDISAPQYEIWEKRLAQSENHSIYHYFLHGATQDDQTNYSVAVIMIGAIWFTWVSKQLIIFIVLLNFLIALIGQNYEEVMTKKTTYMYQHKCRLNEDCLLFYKDARQLRDFNTLLIYSNNERADQAVGDSWEGTTQTMKTLIIDQISVVNAKLDKQTQMISDFIKSSAHSYQKKDKKSSFKKQRTFESVIIQKL